MEKREKLLTGVLIGIGFFLRVWHLRSLMGFDFDQEVAFAAVDRILTGDLTLIGQEISLGGSFIGPAYYYLLAFFVWIFGGDPIAAGVMVAIIATATMLVLFATAASLGNSRVAFLALLIYTTSSRINFYDRTTAPSNPLMLATLLVVYLVMRVERPNDWRIPAAVTVAALAAFHLHPTAIVLFPLIAIFWYRLRLPQPSRRNIWLSIILVTAVVFPLLLFDARNDFLITRNTLHSLRTPGNEAYTPILKILLVTRIQFEQLASLIVPGKVGLVMALGSVMIFLGIKAPGKKLLLAWILVPTVMLSFYTRHIPEYYLLSSLPALAILLALVVDALLQKGMRTAVILGMTWAITLSLVRIATYTNPYSLGRKQAVIRYIKASTANPIVGFDTDPGLDSGFRYLAGKEGILAADAGKSPTHIIVAPPQRRVSQGEEIFGGIKVIESSRRIEDPTH